MPDGHGPDGVAESSRLCYKPPASRFGDPPAAFQGRSGWADTRGAAPIGDMRERTMKEGIHPNYRPAKIACACGMVYETGSTRGDYQVEICSNCHPFYTGKQKLLDTAGRVDRFKRKYADRAQPQP